MASMKSFRSKADDGPSGDDPGDPGGPKIPTETPSEPTTSETASMTRQSRNAEVNFRGQRRSNATHASSTDPDARLYKKSPGAGAMPCFVGGEGSENDPGDHFPDDGLDGYEAWSAIGSRTMPIAFRPDRARRSHPGRWSCRAACCSRHDPSPLTRIDASADAGADKAFDTADFVADL